MSTRTPSCARNTDRDSTIPTFQEPRFSQSLERGLAILPCFTAEHPVLGIADIADQLGMSRSTTHRYVITLVALGYLEQNASRKYRLGLGPTNLGRSALDSTGLGEPARPHLEKLQRSTCYYVGLGVLDGAQVVYVDHLRNRCHGYAVDGPNVCMGVRVPAYCTSMGKLLLAFLPEEDREDILTQNGHTQRTKRTVTKEKLREQLMEIPTVGYAISDEEFYPGARSLAVPVRDDTGVVAAVNLAVYEAALPVQDLVDFYPLVGATAEKISRTLGYEPDKDGNADE